MKRCPQIVGMVGAIKLRKVVIPVSGRAILATTVIKTLPLLVTLALSPIILVVTGGT
jgi:hypothetical protein